MCWCTALRVFSSFLALDGRPVDVALAAVQHRRSTQSTSPTRFDYSHVAAHAVTATCSNLYVVFCLNVLLTAPVLGPETSSKQETAREQALEADTLRSSLQSGERRSKEVTTQSSRRFACGRGGCFARLPRPDLEGTEKLRRGRGRVLLL